jgi:MFS family permease
VSYSGPAAPAHTLRASRNALLALFMIGGVTVSTWGPRLPSIRADLGIGDAVIGLVLACVAVGSVAGLAASSALLSWLGARRAIQIEVVLIAGGLVVVGVGAGVAGSLLVTTIGFVAIGFGLGWIDITLNVEAAAVERLARRTLMPLMHGGWSVGAIVGSAIGAAATALSIPFTAQFVGEAVAMAIVGFLAVRFLPRPSELEDVDAGVATVARPPVLARIRDWLSGWTDLRLLLIGLVMLGVELGEGTANSWLTLAVRDDHHQTDTVAALFFTAFAIGESAARIFGGPVVDRVGRVWAIRITTAIGVVGLLLFILGGAPWIVLVGVLLWSVGVSMGFPLGMSAAADSGPNPAARVSVVASLGYVANLGGPPVIGLLAESFGLLDALWLVVALFVVAFLVAGALGKPKNPSKAGTP